jgi:hypothetical protein
MCVSQNVPMLYPWYIHENRPQKMMSDQDLKNELTKPRDEIWELEMFIRCFPQTKFQEPMPKEWGLFKHAIRNVEGRDDKVSRSKVKAAKLLWNEYNKKSPWDDLHEYEDVETWKAASSTLDSKSFQDLTVKILEYDFMLIQCDRLATKVEEEEEQVKVSKKTKRQKKS